MLGFTKLPSKNENLLLYELSKNEQSIKPFDQEFEYKKHNLYLKISKNGIREV